MATLKNGNSLSILDFTLKKITKEKHESPARATVKCERPSSTRASLPDRNKYVPTFRDKINYVILLCRLLASPYSFSTRTFILKIIEIHYSTLIYNNQ